MSITPEIQLEINRIYRGLNDMQQTINKINADLAPIKERNKKCEEMYRRACQQGETCPITGDTFRGISHYCITDCWHMFERSALDSWKNSGRSAAERCPVCRRTYKIIYSI
jgi:hypothetical protein